MTTLAYDAMTGECIRVDPNALALAAKDALVPDPARALECSRQETRRNRNARKRLNRRLRREEHRKHGEAPVTKANEPPSLPPSLPPPLPSQSSPCGESGGAAAANTMAATAIDHDGSQPGSQFAVVLRSVLLSLLHELQRSNTDGARDTTPQRNHTRCTEEWVAALILHRRLAELGEVERNVTRLLSRELRFTMDRMMPTTSASTVSIVATWREQALQILGGDDCNNNDAWDVPLNSPV